MLKVRKYHYLYNVSDPMIWNGHIDESVFALSFQENVVVFLKVRINDSTVHLYSLACIQHPTIQVWGLFPFIYFQVLPQPS